MIARILMLFCVIAFNLGISSCESDPSTEALTSDPQKSPETSTGETGSNSETSVVVSGSSELKLKNIFVTYRSHEHTASDYPKGPNITNIPETQSKLTEDGKDHAYNLGQYLKTNYSTSLFSGKETLQESDFYSKGTSTRRTQESAMLVAAGLLEQESKKTEEDLWTEEKGQKYMFDKTQQYIKFYNMDKCPAFYKAVAELVQKDEFKQNVSSYLETVTKVGEIYPNVTQSNPATVWLAYETLWSWQQEKQEKKTLPEKITDEMMEKLKKYSEQFVYTAESSTKSKKISGGVMVDGLLSKFESEENKSNMRPMSLLAAPQGVLGAMLGAFSPKGTKYNGSEFNAENFYPGNGSYHILEYYEGQNKEKNFKVLYTPGWGNPPLPLIYNGCDTTSGLCTLEQLKEALKEVRLKAEEQDKTCKGEQNLIDIIKDALSDLLKNLLSKFSFLGNQSR